MSDQVSKNSDNQSGTADGASKSTDTAYKILSEQSGQSVLNGDSQNLQVASATNAMVGKLLPNVTIAGNDSTSPLIKADPKYVSDEDGSLGHFVGDCLSVGGIIKDGAWKEITEHPVDLLVTGVEGLAIGAVATLLAPEVAAFAIGAAVTYGGMQLWDHLGGWMHDADVVTSPEDYTDKEVATAHQDLEGVGSGGAHLIAGTLGGFAAKPLMVVGDALLGSLGSEMSAAEADALFDSMARDWKPSPSTAGDTAVTLTAVESIATGTTEGAAAATTEGAAAATTEGAAAATTEGAVAATTEGSAEWIAQNQEIFRAAQNNNALESLTSRPESVTLERVGPGGTAIENPLYPDGMMPVSEGDWIFTGTTPEGVPYRQVSVDADFLLEHYNVTPQQLAESSKFTVPVESRTTPSHMVKLPDGDWLVNSDYNAATGTPGKGFYKLSSDTYDTWYNPLTKPTPFIPDPSLPVLPTD